MVSTLPSVPDSQVLVEFADQCGIRDTSRPEVLRKQLVAEWARLTLADLALGASSGFAAVHVQSVISAVGQQLSSVWPDLARGSGLWGSSQGVHPTTAVLRELRILGEAFAPKAGYWLPAPLRLVAVPSSELVALVGGVSGGRLRHVAPSLFTLGYGRFVRRQDIPSDLAEANLWQEWSDWIGFTPRNPIAWAHERLGEVQSRGAASSENFLDFEVYVPDLRRTLGVSGFWTPAERLRDRPFVNGFRLARGLRSRYFAGAFAAGRLVSELPLDRAEAMWIAAGLCMESLERIGFRAKDGTLVVYARPVAVQRLLLAFACPVSDDEGRTRYYVPQEGMAMLEELLGRYGFAISEHGGGAKWRTRQA